MKATDPKIPSLDDALNPETAARALGAVLGPLVVREARLIRHRAGRRALVRYRLNRSERREVVLGKIRARGTDKQSHAVQSELHDAGIPVPRTLGLVPEFSMWLQEEIDGAEATKLLGGDSGKRVAAQAARLVRSLHSSGVKPRREPHTIEDELRILEERLPAVRKTRPELSGRIRRLTEAAGELAQGTPAPPGTTGIHRDFYQDQTLLGGDGRLYLLDLDLYCEGDPALDAGNFLAHTAEQSLREAGSPDALAACEESFLKAFLEDRADRGELTERIRTYRTLTLMRHVWISNRIPERRVFTPQILSLCESLLSGRHPA
ncbi:phosphotransferase [Rubrobacter indicoceani]|uniref:phosphotransferase n=1 Tax=Rubrobacter indicoceani TaxID=2051957 RepID=UPI000E5B224F|nr:phosphotransferase [Rubrobacter indicoceani]